MRLIKSKKIKIAIVGCGRISRNHFDSIDSNSEFIQLISVCDNDEIVLAYNEEKYKVNGYVYLEEMLKNEKLDLVSICTPSGLHSEQTKLCANYGVNVITEKPMATSWKDGISMVKACEKANVGLFVVKQNRHNETLKLLKRAVTEKRFGKINMVHINVFWTRPQDYYDQAEWRGTWELDGGAFMNQASHYVDLLDWLIGPIKKVNAMMSTTRDIEVEDTGVLNIEWQDGSLGSMSVTMLTYPKNLEGSITILGEKGTVRVGGVAVNDIQHWDFEDAKDYDNSVKDVNYQTSSIYGFGHNLYYKNVIEVLFGRANPETNGKEGLKSLEILIAGYLSAKDEKTIYLPLKDEL
jgi:UDP-N-acetyl-2-amino-2-deoxyglucuronate dehydrogenase